MTLLCASRTHFLILLACLLTMCQVMLCKSHYNVWEVKWCCNKGFSLNFKVWKLLVQEVFLASWFKPQMIGSMKKRRWATNPRNPWKYCMFVASVKMLCSYRLCWSPQIGVWKIWERRQHPEVRSFVQAETGHPEVPSHGLPLILREHTPTRSHCIQEIM